MSPSFCDNDYVFIAPVLFGHYRPGDVVVARHFEFGLIVKRVADVRSNELELKGDNLKSSQIGWIPLSTVVGKVRFHFKAPR